MSNKKRNHTIFATRIFLIISIFGLLIIPGLFSDSETDSPIDYKPTENALQTNGFTKDDYSPILTGNSYGLGNITIDDMKFNEIRPGLVNNTGI